MNISPGEIRCFVRDIAEVHQVPLTTGHRMRVLRHIPLPDERSYGCAGWSTHRGCQSFTLHDCAWLVRSSRGASCSRVTPRASRTRQPCLTSAQHDHRPAGQLQVPRPWQCPTGRRLIGGCGARSHRRSRLPQGLRNTPAPHFMSSKRQRPQTSPATPRGAQASPPTEPHRAAESGDCHRFQLVLSGSLVRTVGPPRPWCCRPRFGNTSPRARIARCISGRRDVLAPGDSVLCLGQPDKPYKVPRLVEVIANKDSGRSCDVRLPDDKLLLGVARSQLRSKGEANPDTFAKASSNALRARRRRAAAELAARNARPEASSSLAHDSQGLAPSSDRLAEIANAAQDAMSAITARAVCAVCCCTTQEANTVAVVVSEEPPTAWHSKLTVTPAMNLHAELRAQYAIGEDGADVHPLWTEMCGSHSGLDRRPSDAVVRLTARCSRVTPHALRLCSRLLCPTSLHCSGLGDWWVDVCKTCKSSLDAKRTVSPPKNSIANGNFRGYASLVPELADLPEPGSHTATWSTSGQWDFARTFRTGTMLSSPQRCQHGCMHGGRACCTS